MVALGLPQMELALGVNKTPEPLWISEQLHLVADDLRGWNTTTQPAIDTRLIQPTV
jgi:hypothetical protein